MGYFGDRIFNHMGFWALLSISITFLYLNAILLAVLVFPITLIIMCLVFLAKNYQRFDQIFIAQFLGRQHFLKVQEHILESYFGLITKHSINNRALSEVCLLHQEHLPRILLFFVYHPEFSQQLPSKTQVLLENYQQSNFSTYHLNRILNHYRYSIADLTTLIVRGTSLPAPQIERFMCECGVSERQLLENTLPSDHPLLHQIQHQNRVFLSNGFLLLL